MTQPDLEASRLAYAQFTTEAVAFARDDLAMDDDNVEKMKLAMGRTQLKWTGHPLGTVMFNRETKSHAHRVPNPEGVPVWHVSHADGSVEDWVIAQLPAPWEVRDFE